MVPVVVTGAGRIDDYSAASHIRFHQVLADYMTMCILGYPSCAHSASYFPQQFGGGKTGAGGSRSPLMNRHDEYRLNIIHEIYSRQLLQTRF
jgi:hypothetical protein